MLWELKNNKNTREIAKKICSVYGDGVITDCQVWNLFSRFRSGDVSLRDDEPRPESSSDLDLDA